MKTSRARPPITPTATPITHLQNELDSHAGEAGRTESTRGDKAGHQRNADRIVGTRLALEDGAAATGDLPFAQDGENHGRISGRHRRGHEHRRVPVDSACVVQYHRRAGGGEERAHDTDRQNGDRRRTESRRPDVHTAVEQHQHQRDGDHVLYGPFGRWTHRRHGVHRHRGSDQHEQGHRDFDPLGETVRQHRNQTDGTGEQDNQRVPGGLVHDFGLCAFRSVDNDIADQTSRHTATESSCSRGVAQVCLARKRRNSSQGRRARRRSPCRGW